MKIKFLSLAASELFSMLKMNFIRELISAFIEIHPSLLRFAYYSPSNYISYERKNTCFKKIQNCSNLLLCRLFTNGTSSSYSSKVLQKLRIRRIFLKPVSTKAEKAQSRFEIRVRMSYDCSLWSFRQAYEVSW